MGCECNAQKLTEPNRFPLLTDQWNRVQVPGPTFLKLQSPANKTVRFRMSRGEGKPPANAVTEEAVYQVRDGHVYLPCAGSWEIYPSSYAGSTRETFVQLAQGECGDALLFYLLHGGSILTSPISTGVQNVNVTQVASQVLVNGTQWDQEGTEEWKRLKVNASTYAYFLGQTSTPLGALATFTGPSSTMHSDNAFSDVGPNLMALYIYWACYVFADVAGTVQWQGSYAQVTWRNYGAAVAIAAATLTQVTRDYRGFRNGRVQYVNGALAQATFEFQTYMYGLAT